MSSTIEQFDQAQLGLGLAAAAMITTGVSGVLTGYENSPQRERFKRVGALLFLVGWIVMTITMIIGAHGALRDDNSPIVPAAMDPVLIIIAIVAAIAIVFGAAYAMFDRYHVGNTHELRANSGALLRTAKMSFVFGWILIAFAASFDNSLDRFDGRKAALAFIGAGTIMGTMGGVLPTERQHNIVNGPGLGLFTIGWILFVLGKARVSSNE